MKTKVAGEAQTQGIPITYDALFNLTAVTNTLYPCLTDDVLGVLLRVQNTQNCVGYYVVVRIPFYIGAGKTLRGISGSDIRSTRGRWASDIPYIHPLKTLRKVRSANANLTDISSYRLETV